MNKKSLQNEILNLLATSSISDHNKEMVRILLPVMELPVMKNIYKTLSEEKVGNLKLDEKQKRIELQYKVLIEKLIDVKLKETPKN